MLPIRRNRSRLCGSAGAHGTSGNRRHHTQDPNSTIPPHTATNAGDAGSLARPAIDIPSTVPLCPITTAVVIGRYGRSAGRTDQGLGATR